MSDQTPPSRGWDTSPSKFLSEWQWQKDGSTLFHGSYAEQRQTMLAMLADYKQAVESQQAAQITELKSALSAERKEVDAARDLEGDRIASAVFDACRQLGIDANDSDGKETADPAEHVIAWIQGLCSRHKAQAAALSTEVERLKEENQRFKEIGQGFERDARNTFEQSCKNLERAEKAEAEVDRLTQENKATATDRRILLAQLLGIDHASMGQPCEAPSTFDLLEQVAYGRGWRSVHDSAVAMEMTRRINTVAERCSKVESELQQLRQQGAEPK